MTTEVINENPRIRALVEEGEEVGCINLSAFSEAVQELELDDSVIHQLQDELDRRGLDVTDDCGRDEIEPTRVTGSELATSTTDALQLFLNEVRRHPLLTADEEKQLSQRIEQG